MNVRIETQNLGLAAYIKMNGGQVVSVANRTYVFNTPDKKTLDEWTVEYSNSCCQKHDNELMGLRKMMFNASG